MSDSREQSPDWMHSFKVPTHSTISVSSDSELSQDNSPLSEDKDDDKLSLRAFLRQPKRNENRAGVSSEAGSPKNVLNEKSPKGKTQEDKVFIRNKKMDNETKGSEASLDPNTKPEYSENTMESSELKAYRSRRISKGKDSPTADCGGWSPSTKTLKGKASEKLSKVDRLQEMEEKADDLEKKGSGKDIAVAEEETSAKHREPHVSSSRLPLVLSEKIHLSKALIECEGDSIDLSGDAGAVGRVVIYDTPSGDHEMYLDLKGTIYKTTIVPSRTFCVVSFGPSEAKIEAIMNDFIQLNPQSNFNEAETMVEGTMEGFSFDSDEEADLVPKSNPQEGDPNDVTEKQTKGRSKRKAEKTSELPRKKVKTGGSKAQQSKKVRKKTQGSKKATARR